MVEDVVVVVLVGLLVRLTADLDGFRVAMVVVVDVVFGVGEFDVLGVTDGIALVDVEESEVPFEVSVCDAGKAERTQTSPICLKGVLH